MIKANQNFTLTAVDRVGAMVSFACAVHCAVLPIALAFLPVLGLSILAHGTFERFMLCLSLLFGITSA